MVKAEYKGDTWVIEGALPGGPWRWLGQHGMFLNAVVLAQAALKGKRWAR